MYGQIPPGSLLDRLTHVSDPRNGREIGLCLSTLRNIAISLIRRQGYPYIPDGWRDIASQSDRGLPLLIAQKINTLRSPAATPRRLTRCGRGNILASQLHSTFSSPLPLKPKTCPAWG